MIVNDYGKPAKTWQVLIYETVQTPITGQTTYSAANPQLGILNPIPNRDIYAYKTADEYTKDLRDSIDENILSPAELTRIFYRDHLQFNYSRLLQTIDIIYKSDKSNSGLKLYKWIVIHCALYSAMSAYGLVRNLDNVIPAALDIIIDDVRSPESSHRTGLDVFIWRMFKNRSNNSFLKRNLMRTLSLIMMDARSHCMTVAQFHAAIEVMSPVMNVTDLEVVVHLKQCLKHLNSDEVLVFNPTYIGEHLTAKDDHTLCIFDKTERSMSLQMYGLIIFIITPLILLYDNYKARRYGWNHKLAVGNKASLQFGKSGLALSIKPNLHRPILESIAKTLLPLEGDLNSRKVEHLRQQVLLFTRAVSTSQTLNPDEFLEMVSCYDVTGPLIDTKHHLLQVLGNLAVFAKDDKRVNPEYIIFTYMYIAHIKLNDPLAGIRKGSIEMDINTWLAM